MTSPYLVSSTGNGKVVVDSAHYGHVRDFSEGLCPASARSSDMLVPMEKWGFVDKTGKWQIQPAYPKLRSILRWVATLSRVTINRQVL